MNMLPMTNDRPILYVSDSDDIHVEDYRMNPSDDRILTRNIDLYLFRWRNEAKDCTLQPF